MPHAHNHRHALDDALHGRPHDAAPHGQAPDAAAHGQAQDHSSHSREHIGHSHGNDGHSHGHGGHSHGAPNPYDRECQAPTTAAVYCAGAAFLGSLSAVSLPTHITGYFLPSIPRTSLLWATVLVGAAYAVLTIIAFFTVLEESVSEHYRAPLVEGEENATAKSMKKLKGINLAAAGALVVETALSIALFALGLRFSAEEWNDWCSNNAVIVVASEGSGETHNAAVSEVCEEMHLNQTYLVLAIPGLMLLLELVRFWKTSQFMHLALDRTVQVTEEPFTLDETQQLPRSSLGEDFGGDALRSELQNVREMGRRRQREERRRRRYRHMSSSDSDGEDEKGLLSV